jgi:hypothetical protein
MLHDAFVVSLERSDLTSSSSQPTSARWRTRRTSRVRTQVSGRCELPQACDRPCAERSSGGPARERSARPLRIRSVRDGALGVQEARSPNPTREWASTCRPDVCAGAAERSRRVCRAWRRGSYQRAPSASRQRTADGLDPDPSDRARRSGPGARSSVPRPDESSNAGRTRQAPELGAGSTGSGACATGPPSPDDERQRTGVMPESTSGPGEEESE